MPKGLYILDEHIGNISALKHRIKELGYNNNISISEKQGHIYITVIQPAIVLDTSGILHTRNKKDPKWQPSKYEAYDIYSVNPYRKENLPNPKPSPYNDKPNPSGNAEQRNDYYSAMIGRLKRKYGYAC